MLLRAADFDADQRRPYPADEFHVPRLRGKSLWVVSKPRAIIIKALRPAFRTDSAKRSDTRLAVRSEALGPVGGHRRGPYLRVACKTILLDNVLESVRRS